MMAPVRYFALVVTVLIFALPGRAQSWDVVRGLQPGDRVKVLERDGAEHKGAIASVTPDAISLDTGKTQVSVERPRVRRVQLHSGSRRARNIAIGVGVGLAIGVAVDQTAGAYLRNEVGDTGRPAMYLAPIGLCGAIGAIVSPYRTVYKVK